MIKAAGTGKDGSPIVMFGLSTLNLEKLKEGKPIMVNLADVGMVGSLIIFWGETEQAIVASFIAAGISIPT